jgi:predicted AlkP superfamily phosphohydrolase/phosphomutase
MGGEAPPKVAIIGMDCAEPSLVFDRFKHKLPTLTRLAAAGAWGRLRSCDPCITVPAWMSMMSSRDPGVLGFYGFRNRVDYSYDKLAFANSKSVKEPLLWDYLGKGGKQSILLSVPQTYPPRPVNGCLVTDFLTPSTSVQWTYPPELKQELTQEFGEYLFDVPNFRTDDKARLKADLFRMTEQRFAVARHLVTTRDWDLFMMVEMGTDRVHHGFWKFMDPTHPKYERGNPFENVIEEHYILVDSLIEELLELLPPETAVLLVSDHGAKGMAGGICINEWLIRQGYLVLKERPKELTRFDKLQVDWTRTRAWGEGGYYGRVFLNVAGREPQGVIPRTECTSFRDRLIQEIEAIPDDHGKPIGTRAMKAEDLYQQCNGVPSDLLVYFGNLHWRSVGTVGHPGIHTFENDTGPDDANHAEYGIFIFAGPKIRPLGQIEDRHLMDITPTVLTMMGQAVPPQLQGRPMRDIVTDGATA